MHENNTDRQLVSRLLNKEDTAYRQLIGEHHKNLLHTISAIAGPAMAEDILQDTWLTVMQSLPRFEFRSRLKTWIYAIAVNTARAYLRKSKRNVSLENISGIQQQDERFDQQGHWKAEFFPSLWETDNPESLLNSRQLLEQMDNSLNKLPPLQRAVLLMKDQQGMEFEEIAQILDVTENNTRVLLHRARKVIHQSIDRYQQEKGSGLSRQATAQQKHRCGFLGANPGLGCQRTNLSAA